MIRLIEQQPKPGPKRGHYPYEIVVVGYCKTVAEAKEELARLKAERPTGRYFMEYGVCP